MVSAFFKKNVDYEANQNNKFLHFVSCNFPGLIFFLVTLIGLPLRDIS